MTDLAIPFSDEEVDHLSELAAANGAASVQDYVRYRVFGPLGPGASPEDIVAQREGELIRRGSDNDAPSPVEPGQELEDEPTVPDASLEELQRRLAETKA